jgi:hypothetical protein
MSEASGKILGCLPVFPRKSSSTPAKVREHKKVSSFIKLLYPFSFQRQIQVLHNYRDYLTPRPNEEYDSLTRALAGMDLVTPTEKLSVSLDATGMSKTSYVMDELVRLTYQNE